MKYIIQKFFIVILASIIGIIIISILGFSDETMFLFGGLLPAIAVAGAMTSWHPELNSKKEPDNK